jgi:muramoyltetrapeptide carboxypeptidase LdcA involved in peptidoglycan recycling
MEPWDQSLKDAYDMLCGRKLNVNGYDKWESESLKDEEHPLVPYNLTEKKILKVYMPDGGRLAEKTNNKKTEINGRLLGGCLDCLVTILGTKFDRVTDFSEKYKNDGIIWFIESCDLNVMGIRRAVWQMKNAGWFKHVRGFLIGRPCVFGQEMMGLDQYHAVTDLLGEYGVPVIMDADIGHMSPMMPLITGSVATIKVHRNNISVSMQLK